MVRQLRAVMHTQTHPQMHHRHDSISGIGRVDGCRSGDNPVPSLGSKCFTSFGRVVHGSHEPMSHGSPLNGALLCVEPSTNSMRLAGQASLPAGGPSMVLLPAGYWRACCWAFRLFWGCSLQMFHQLLLPFVFVFFPSNRCCSRRQRNYNQLSRVKLGAECSPLYHRAVAGASNATASPPAPPPPLLLLLLPLLLLPLLLLLLVSTAYVLKL